MAHKAPRNHPWRKYVRVASEEKKAKEKGLSSVAVVLVPTAPTVGKQRKYRKYVTERNDR